VTGETDSVVAVTPVTPVTPVTLEEMRGLVAHQFPGGTFTIEPWEARLICDVMECDPLPDGLAHPAFLFHAPLAGLGLKYQEIFALCRAESAEAVRAGEYIWDVRRPLRVGVTYRMSGGIDGVERKRGRRAGLMDLVSFHIDMHDTADDTLCAAVSNSWVFLRSEA
jgi:hypothetical protein